MTNGTTGKDGFKKDADVDNSYKYVAGTRAADFLESTQTGRFGVKGGTGFAAEDANAFQDIRDGKTVTQVGKDNALNGADRISNGQPIQTKYFDSASRTVRAAFDENGMYRYSGQVLEVPHDQYKEAIALMRKRISEGKVPGFTNPDDASQLVKQGSVTYRQAVNIARGGNLDSLKYDARNQVVSTMHAAAIGFVMNYAVSVWHGKPQKEALKGALWSGFAAGTTSFVAGVATAQLLRTNGARAATVAARHVVRGVAKTKLGGQLVNHLAKFSLGKSVQGGAAINHVSKLARSTAIASTVATVVVTLPSAYRAAVHGTESWKQVGKKFVTNGAGAAGGGAGWMAGAATGALIGSAIPLVGTGIGGFVGACVGGVSGGHYAEKASKYVMDKMVDDDASEMLNILDNDVLPHIYHDFFLSEEEATRLNEEISALISEEFLREMFAHKDRVAWAYVKFDPLALAITKTRTTIPVPTEQAVQEAIAAVEEEAVSELRAEQQESANTSESPESQDEASLTSEKSGPYIPNFVFFQTSESGKAANEQFVTTPIVIGRPGIWKLISPRLFG